MDDIIYQEYITDDMVTGQKSDEPKSELAEIPGDDLQAYRYMRDGDMHCVIRARSLVQGATGEEYSDDVLMDAKYRFVSSVTLATLFVLQGGFPPESAEQLKKLYVGRLDDCDSADAVMELHTIMFLDYTRKMQELKEANGGKRPEPVGVVKKGQMKISRPISQAIDHIRHNLHTKLTLKEIGNAANLSPNYLATLFHKEVGKTVQDYIRDLRVEVAERMLADSDYTLSEIGRCLGYKSNSHFIKVFREQIGITPKKFRMRHYK